MTSGRRAPTSARIGRGASITRVGRVPLVPRAGRVPPVPGVGRGPGEPGIGDGRCGRGGRRTAEPRIGRRGPVTRAVARTSAGRVGAFRRAALTVWRGPATSTIVRGGPATSTIVLGGGPAPAAIRRRGPVTGVIRGCGAASGAIGRRGPATTAIVRSGPATRVCRFGLVMTAAGEQPFRTPAPPRRPAALLRLAAASLALADVPLTAVTPGTITPTRVTPGTVTPTCVTPRSRRRVGLGLPGGAASGQVPDPLKVIVVAETAGALVPLLVEGVVAAAGRTLLPRRGPRLGDGLRGPPRRWRASRPGRPSVVGR